MSNIIDAMSDTGLRHQVPCSDPDKVDQGFQTDNGKTPAFPAASELKTQEEKAPATLTASESKTQEKATVPSAASKPESQQNEVSAADEEWLDAIEKKFSSIAGEDRLINYEEFRNAIDSKQEIFVKSYFKLFDEDGSGEIGLDEFMESLRKISQQSDLDKLHFLFGIFDTNGDGEITPEELKVALGACISESSLKMTDDKMDQLVAALMKAADVDNDGVITFEELKAQFEKYPMLVENLAVSPSNWLKLHKKPVRPSILKAVKESATNMYNNNKPLMVFLILHFMTFAGCFLYSAVKYQRFNGWVITARGCGMSLNYHCAILAMSMARRSLTFLRNTPAGPYLAVDDHIEIHKMLGVVTVVLGLVHTVAHLANIGVMVAAGSALTYAQILFTHMSGIGWLYGTAYPSGVLLTIILIIIGVCSSPMIRRAGLFEFFYRTHLLYIPFWVLTLAHGPIFWRWFLVPGLMLFLEHSYSYIIHHRQKVDKKGFFTTEVNLLPSRVTHLVVTRPKSFTFNAGDYVFIRIPTISAWEWHPFSISSAPEEEGIVWIHIRTEGGWTKRLYEFFAHGDYLNTPEELEEQASVEELKGRQPVSLPNGGKSYKYRTKVYIEGPFGSAAVRMGDTNHAVLVAGGIGVTPFASVLQSLITQHRKVQEEQAEKQPRYSDSNKLKKIDFVWVNRKADDFDWFITLLTQLEMEESRQGNFDDFLDMHLFMTAAKSSSDLKGVGLQMALELVHQEDEHDMITGLKTRTQAGRPNWEKLFQTMKEENRGQVHVYFCGSPHLAAAVKSACDKIGFKFSLSL